jgi:alpha-L-rhamnosidase
MTRWVDWVETRLSEGDVWDTGWQYGDWLDPAAPAESPHLGLTEPALVATAYAVRSADIVARVARILGREREGAQFDVLADRVRGGFERRFVSGEGRLTSDSPTAYALAICFELLKDDSWRTAAGARLAQLVEANGFRIATGFVGTPIVCDALCETGHEAEAWRLVLERSCPSWLYPVTMGATTVWERWDSMLPDGSVNTGWMTSFNHYALGAIADWLHRYAAGLAPATPGYRRIRVRPRRCRN